MHKWRKEQMMVENQKPVAKYWKEILEMKNVALEIKQ